MKLTVPKTIWSGIAFAIVAVAHANISDEDNDFWNRFLVKDKDLSAPTDRPTDKPILDIDIDCNSAPTEDCTEIQPPNPVCAAGTNIEAVEFTMTIGRNCNPAGNTQGLQVFCEDLATPSSQEPVTVLCKNSADGADLVVRPSVVANGETFAVTPSAGETAFPDAIDCIYNDAAGNRIQQNIINTSGNVQLNLKDQYGAFTLVSCGTGPDLESCLKTLGFPIRLNNDGTVDMDISKIDFTFDDETKNLIDQLENTVLLPDGTSSILAEIEADICSGEPICANVTVVGELPNGESVTGTDETCFEVPAIQPPTGPPPTPTSPQAVPKSTPVTPPVAAPETLPAPIPVTSPILQPFPISVPVPTPIELPVSPPVSAPVPIPNAPTPVSQPVLLPPPPVPASPPVLVPIPIPNVPTPVSQPILLPPPPVPVSPPVVQPTAAPITPPVTPPVPPPITPPITPTFPAGDCVVDASLSCVTSNGRDCGTITPPPTRTCVSGSDITVLTFTYQNCDCNCGRNSQGDASTCVDISPLVEEPAVISCVSGQGAQLQVSPVPVLPGGTFTVRSASGPLPEMIDCTISANGVVLQQNILEISDAVRLLLIEKFGAMELVACDGLSCIELLTYGVDIANIGAVPMAITRAGFELNGSARNLLESIPTNPLPAGSSTSVSVTVEVGVCNGGEFSAELSVEANPPNGNMCEDSEEITFTISPLPPTALETLPPVALPMPVSPPINPPIAPVPQPVSPPVPVPVVLPPVPVPVVLPPVPVPVVLPPAPVPVALPVILPVVPTPTSVQVPTPDGVEVPTPVGIVVPTPTSSKTGGKGSGKGGSTSGKGSSGKRFLI